MYIRPRNATTFNSAYRIIWKMTLTFDEIISGDQFEDLAVSYFEELKNERENNITSLDVRPSGTGADGGRDILLKLRVADGISNFERIWVVQCKFHERNISTNKVNEVNIPSLIHSYKADGYLLICKKKPTSRLTNFFDGLRVNCRFEYKYEIWSGEQFKRLIQSKSKPTILMQFFPKYFEYVVKNDIIKL